MKIEVISIFDKFCKVSGVSSTLHGGTERRSKLDNKLVEALRDIADRIESDEINSMDPGGLLNIGYDLLVMADLIEEGEAQTVKELLERPPIKRENDPE